MQNISQTIQVSGVCTINVIGNELHSFLLFPVHVQVDNASSSGTKCVIILFFCISMLSSVSSDINYEEASWTKVSLMIYQVHTSRHSPNKHDADENTFCGLNV